MGQAQVQLVMILCIYASFDILCCAQHRFEFADLGL